MPKQTLNLTILIILSSVLSLTACSSPARESMLQETSIPSGVQVVAITEEETVINELTQRKVFDQCEASSTFRPDVRFSQAESNATQEELVLGGTVGGEKGFSELAKVTLEGSVQKQFASSRNIEQVHGEGGTIEVPPYTRQEYTLVWRETRRKGTVEYIEDGVVKTAEYSYRVGLELVSTIGKDLTCPGQETAPSPTLLPDDLLPMPSGYTLLDEFSGEGAPDGQWSAEGDPASCKAEQKDGSLVLECQGNAEQEVRLGYAPRSNDQAVASGVAVVAEMLSKDHVGWFSLLVHFAGPDGSSSIRVYSITLYAAKVQVAEYYPQENWRGELLAEIALAATQPHTLQIDYETGTPQFFLDGELIQLATQPNLPSGSTWQNWLFEGYASTAQGGEPGVSKMGIDWAAIKPVTPH